METENIKPITLPINAEYNRCLGHGDRKGEWSLFVTKNWRLTFRVNEVGAIEDMDLEDYH